MKEKASPKKILVTRTDRLGDVLLATPVLRKLREAYPNAEIVFLVRKLWMPVLQYGKAIRLLEYYPEEDADDLAGRLRSEKFDVAVVIRDEKNVTQAVKRAGIPKRIGPYSTLRSFFSFNSGMFQKRSKCRMHEAEYNLDLLTQLGLPAVAPAESPEELPRSWIQYDPKWTIHVDTWLKERGLGQKKYVCVHPGSSGSARYLPTEVMEQLVRGLLLTHEAVILTGGPQEGSLLEEICHASKVGPVAHGKIFQFGGRHPQDLAALAELYRRAQLVVAHGTGPLHLAAAVATPTYAIFPPIHVLSERRWGPLVSQRGVWTPDVNCPAKYHCLGTKCTYYDCMNRFQVDEAVVRIQQLEHKRANP